MSFARLRASILWSNERTGAWTCVWGGTMRAALYQPHSRVQAPRFGLVCRTGNAVHRDAKRVGRMIEAGACCFDVELVPHAGWGIRVREQHRAECNVRRTARDHLERVASVEDAAHANDRQLGCTSRHEH